MKKFLVSALALAGLVFALQVGNAHASAILTLSDGTTTKTIEDNGVGDLSSDLGVITYLGAIGVWNLNVSTGVTKPYSGSATQPNMDLNSVNGSTAAGTLTMIFTDDLFGPFDGGLFSKVGGTLSEGTGNSAVFSTIVNGIPYNTLNFTSSGAFSGSASAGVAGGTGSTVGLYAKITHGAAGLTSFDSATKVPEPGTLMLLGTGLMGIAFYRRRRNG